MRPKRHRSDAGFAIVLDQKTPRRTLQRGKLLHLRITKFVTRRNVLLNQSYRKSFVNQRAEDKSTPRVVQSLDCLLIYVIINIQTTTLLTNDYDTIKSHMPIPIIGFALVGPRKIVQIITQAAALADYLSLILSIKVCQGVERRLH